MQMQPGSSGISAKNFAVYKTKSVACNESLPYSSHLTLNLVITIPASITTAEIMMGV